MVLEKYLKALKRPLILPFTGGLNTVFEDRYELHQIKASQFYTNLLKFKSLLAFQK